MDEAKPNRKKRSPTVDKQLSYERDGRNAWGESPHGARRSIPKFKKQSTRQMRHGAKQARETRNRRESVKSVLKPGATGPAIRKAGKRK
jgi:hypothetical protein